MHSEMGPVRQNPIQRTVKTAYLSVLMTVHNLVHNTAQNSSDNLPFLPPDNHHSSDVVYQRRKGGWCQRPTSKLVLSSVYP